MTTLKELSKETFNYLKRNEGTSEFDMSINDISIAVIQTMKEEKGTCFFGKINLYGEERKKDYHLVEYTGQKIYNFEYTFCIPCHDIKLEKLINDRDKSPYTGTSEDYKRVTEISDRIQEIGGTHLIWA